MTSFLAQCPNCLTSFRISATQLEAAAGMVRCGACLGVFSAPSNRIRIRQPWDAERLVDDESAASSEDHDGLGDDRDVPLGDLDLDDVDAAYADDDFTDDDELDDLSDAADDDDDDDEEDAVAPDAVDDQDEDDDADNEDTADYKEQDDEDFNEDAVETAGPASLASRWRAADDFEPADKQQLQRYLAALEDEEALAPLSTADLESIAPEPVTISVRQHTRGRLTFAALLALNVLLAGLLALQYIDANKVAFSRAPRLAPLMAVLCQVLECPVPERSELRNLTSRDLLVRSHPRYAGVLEVSFIFSNDAAVTQPFPALELGFSDANNRLIANRLFQPADYLQPELRQRSGIPAQATLQVILEIADPGSEAVNWTVAFREAVR
jgi:predicted Zn finger-like uncharacterized protein